MIDTASMSNMVFPTQELKQEARVLGDEIYDLRHVLQYAKTDLMRTTTQRRLDAKARKLARITKGLKTQTATVTLNPDCVHCDAGAVEIKSMNILHKPDLRCVYASTMPDQFYAEPRKAGYMDLTPAQIKQAVLIRTDKKIHNSVIVRLQTILELHGYWGVPGSDIFYILGLLKRTRLHSDKTYRPAPTFSEPKYPKEPPKTTRSTRASASASARVKPASTTSTTPHASTHIRTYVQPKPKPGKKKHDFTKAIGSDGRFNVRRFVMCYKCHVSRECWDPASMDKPCHTCGRKMVWHGANAGAGARRKK